MRSIATNILDTIGNTPLVGLDRLFHGQRRVLAKLEGSNPAGSMKDRTSYFIISELLKNDIIKRGGTIIESSSGNMAVGLAQACLFYGLKLMVVVDPNLNPQTHKLLTAYGAKIVMVKEPRAKGGFLAARLEKVKELLTTVPNSIWSNQYGNPNNPKAHHTTMSEIMGVLNHDLDYLFIATSTCGTLMGCADYIEKKNCRTKLIAVDAVGSVLFGDKAGKRKIPGHGAGVPSEFLDTSKVYDVVHVSDYECIKGCRRLLTEEAILCGGSSGGIISAYMNYEKHLPENSTSVLLLPDRGERYLDTVYNDEWVNDNIELEQIFDGLNCAVKEVGSKMLAT
ncbi:2,3-diaminopropionate biosynthesis protein SbnA [uncultured Kriegella sp.]|uniref:2,3-diaminopropionate biosynthesis protein SbnA n=1 Tax=uncultured Kriegella sp. TaxID=1798910 RepID=UPI0030D838F9|tara:strand:+ start:40070 stop:41083 length:1014 start_codon:yes stop_codon:yes gene_type:complete